MKHPALSGGVRSHRGRYAYYPARRQNALRIFKKGKAQIVLIDDATLKHSPRPRVGAGTSDAYDYFISRAFAAVQKARAMPSSHLNANPETTARQTGLQFHPLPVLTRELERFLMVRVRPASFPKLLTSKKKPRIPPRGFFLERNLCDA